MQPSPSSASPITTTTLAARRAEPEDSGRGFHSSGSCWFSSCSRAAARRLLTRRHCAAQRRLAVRQRGLARAAPGMVQPGESARSRAWGERAPQRAGASVWHGAFGGPSSDARGRWVPWVPLARQLEQRWRKPARPAAGNGRRCHLHLLPAGSLRAGLCPGSCSQHRHGGDRCKVPALFLRPPHSCHCRRKCRSEREALLLPGDGAQCWACPSSRLSQGHGGPLGLLVRCSAPCVEVGGSRTPVGPPRMWGD